ncbi:hypothetical protein O6H91_13G069300 [Diphasiastrum complanatum]|uniref:Uncharacterized protein n=1 Tax=Diphasiastrum complanatum TaxID=34168 RepID=A0ACC2BVU5_DIPCM|nr:hypothetical protein O6H91_13G069300 [Diphasiastrum complanatum]
MKTLEVISSCTALCKQACSNENITKAALVLLCMVVLVACLFGRLGLRIILVSLVNIKSICLPDNLKSALAALRCIGFRQVQAHVAFQPSEVEVLQRETFDCKKADTYSQSTSLELKKVSESEKEYTSDLTVKVAKTSIDLLKKEVEVASISEESQYANNEVPYTPSPVSPSGKTCWLFMAPEFCSPLLVGSKKSASAGGLRTTSTSNSCKSSCSQDRRGGSKRKRRASDSDLKEMLKSFGMKEVHICLTKKLQPNSISIPRSCSSSETSSPQCSPSCAEKQLLKSSELVEKNERAVTLNGTLPAVAWMCGRDLEGLDQEQWLDLRESCLEDIYGEEWQKFVHPSDLTRCKEIVSLALSVQKQFQMEYRLQIAPDQYRWVLDLAKVRYSLPSHAYIGFVGWRIDIHERKVIQDDFAKLWSLPHEFLIKATGDGKYFESVSSQLPQLLGYTLEEFKSIPWAELIHKDDYEYSVEAEQESKGGSPINVVNRYRCKEGQKVVGPVFTDPSGTYKWLNWSGFDLFGACRDVSAERNALDELQRSREELRRITDAIPGGGVFTCQINENGVETFPFASKGFMNLLGSHTNETNDDNSSIGLSTNPSQEVFKFDERHKAFGFSIHPDDWPRLAESMRNASFSLTPLDHDFRVIRDGEICWSRMHALPQWLENGKLQWFGITWDMTEQHLAVDTLREARDNAEKAAQAKGRFLANMSHEIRTPMNAVIGMGALLLETALTEEQREYVSTIRSSGEALLTIINDILDYSKIEAGKMQLEVVPFDLLHCLEDSFDLIIPQATMKGLDLSYNIGENVPGTIKGDATRLRQILVNLLSNAVKFTEHGNVSVAINALKVARESLPKATGFLETETDKASREYSFKSGEGKETWKIQFSVEDSGIGISDEKKSTLFKPFSQVDASTTRRFGGTGLGLVICSKLCALQGGDIWVESIAGHGSTFHFTIVAEEVPKIKHDGLEVVDGDNDLNIFKNKRVLIVAGSSSSSQTMCLRFLRSWGMKPLCTSSSDEALKVLGRTLSVINKDNDSRTRDKELNMIGPIDVAIIDGTMLDDGDTKMLECFRLCQAATPKISIVVLTHFGQRFLKEFHDVEVHCHISKPVKESHLQNALFNLLQREESSSEADGEGSNFSKKNPSCSQPTSKTWRKGSGSISMTPENHTDVAKAYPLRILVAEDNAINQKVLTRLLQRLGYSADVVANGFEALEAVVRQRYDVCLMDCFMPEMDGLEATKRIRETLQCAPIIVAVTAAALEEEKQACLEAGMHM